MLRDTGRLGVGGAIRHGVDRRALHLVAVARQGVGVDRDEKRGIEPARDAHALAERHEGVVLAGQDDLVMVAGAQFGRQNLGEIEHDEFLDGVVAAQRAGVDAAVAGIDHDHGLLRGGRGRGAAGWTGAGVSSAAAWACFSAPARAAALNAASDAGASTSVSSEAPGAGPHETETIAAGPVRSATIRDLPGASLPNR